MSWFSPPKARIQDIEIAPSITWQFVACVLFFFSGVVLGNILASAFNTYIYYGSDFRLQNTSNPSLHTFIFDSLGSSIFYVFIMLIPFLVATFVSIKVLKRDCFRHALWAIGSGLVAMYLVYFVNMLADTGSFSFLIAIASSILAPIGLTHRSTRTLPL